MKIAILAWGSLIWDQRTLRLDGNWQTGGPILPIEFSRVSSDGRLTLVIDPHHGVPVTTRFAPSAFTNLNDAISNLREREGTSSERIGFVNLLANTEREYSRQQHPAACESIKAWAQANDWQAVIWTALVSNFESDGRPPFSTPAAVAYVNSLTGKTQACALEYVNRAPVEVDTPVRRQLLAQHDYELAT
jgi:hypothetical protein